MIKTLLYQTILPTKHPNLYTKKQNEEIYINLFDEQSNKASQ